VHIGLSTQPKYLQAKYFYDETGSELFERITEQPEYYPTRTEAHILRTHAADIRQAMDGDICLVELGSGSSNKTTILLKSLLEEQDQLHYMPIDISPEILNESAKQLNDDYDGLATIPIASEFDPGLVRANWIISQKDKVPDRKLVLFLGSSIGNFETSDSESFLKMVRDKMRGGDGLLIGFDLQKNHEVLNAAYNDQAGVTARFNLNILTRINRELGGTFELDRFSHSAFYNDVAGRIEMHLVSDSKQEVALRKLGESFTFAENETIHTESSYKYTPELIEDIVGKSGLKVEQLFTDDKNWFAVALLLPA
jgi:dimethylhistidine N-methyltransferase